MTEDRKDQILDRLTDLMQAVHENRVKWCSIETPSLYNATFQKNTLSFTESDTQVISVHMIVKDGISLRNG